MTLELSIDDDLIRAAVQVGHHPSKEAAVIHALEDYVRRQKQLEVLDLFGQIEYDEDYDYKTQRAKT